MIKLAIYDLLLNRVFKRGNLTNVTEPEPSDLIKNFSLDQTRLRTGRRLRVLLYISNRDIGGMEEHVLLLARYLDRSCFEVFAICPGDERPKLRPFREALATVADHVEALTFDHENIKNFPKLVRLIKAWKIDIIHMHDGYCRGHAHSFLAAKLAHVNKTFITEHQAPEQPEPLRYRLLRNLLTLMVTNIICVSERNYAARASTLWSPRNRVLVVDNGVDLAEFNPTPPQVLAELRQRYNLPENAQIVGSVIRFVHEKGLPYLIDALPLIREKSPDAYLMLVGDGVLREELEAQVARLGMQEYVRFVGFHKDPRPFYDLIDAFVLPVPFGSASIALLEAMAMRRATVITFGGPGEASIHNQTGLWAEPRNPASIAQQVVRILENPQFKECLGKSARKHVENHFSAQAVAHNIEQIYTRN